MRRIGVAGAGMLLAGPLVLCLASRAGGAQPTDDATRQYAAAAALQNKGAYELAAEQWKDFIARHPADERIPRAYHYYGVCLYQSGTYAQALAVFEKASALAKSDLHASSQLYLGATQFALAQGGKREMYERAATTLRGLLGKNPRGEHVAEALYYLGECLYAQGKRAEAAESYSQLVERFPDHKFAADALYALGVAQEESGNRAAAAGSFEKFLARFRDHRLAAEVTMRLGEALLAEGRHADAANRFAAAAARPDFKLADYAALRQADAVLGQKQYSQAAALYAEMASKFPQSPHAGRAWLAAGRCLYSGGKYADAHKPLTTAMALGGAPAAEAAHWLARSLLKQQQPGEALAVLDRFLPGAGDSAFAAQLLLDRADAVYELPERRKESAGLYAEVAAKYPKDPAAPQALYMAGFAALETGDFAAALGHARKFIAAHPDHVLAPDVLHVAAESNLQLGKLAEAEGLYQKLAERYAGHADADLWKVRRAAALSAQKKHQETIRALEPLVAALRSPECVAEARYLIGSSQLELGQSDAAIRSLGASLAAQPKWRQADETCLALAEAHRQAGDLEKARAAAERVIAQFPSSRVLDRAHFRLGTYLALAGQAGAAAAEYQKLLTQWPESPLAPHALHELGCARLSEKDAAGAEAALSTLLEKHAQHALASRARYARAMARQQQGKHAEAVADLEAVLGPGPAAPDKSDARFLLGLCQVELKQHAKAAATLRALLDEDPKYAAAEKVLYQLGWALKLSGREEEASQAFARLVREHSSSPLVPEAQFNVGEFHFQSKSYATAAKAYYAALEKTEGTPLGEKVAYKLAWCYYHQGSFADARETFAYQLQKYPDGPLAADAAFMQAECLFRQGKFREALAGYEKLKKPPSKESHATALLHAGQAAGQLKQWRQSADWLERLAREVPDAASLPEALYELGWARQNLGQPAEAIAAYEQAIAKTDREVAARAQFMIGEIQFEQKEHKEAVKSFFKVAYGYSAPKWQADATYEAARCFEVLGQKTQAAAMYRELLEKYPQSDKLPLARQRLSELAPGK